MFRGAFIAKPSSFGVHAYCAYLGSEFSTLVAWNRRGIVAGQEVDLLSFEFDGILPYHPQRQAGSAAEIVFMEKLDFGSEDFFYGNIHVPFLVVVSVAGIYHIPDSLDFEHAHMSAAFQPNASEKSVYGSSTTPKGN